MTTRIAVALLGLFLAGASHVEGQEARHTTSSVRIRAEANTNSKVVTTVPRGARVDIRACAVEWCWIEYEGRTGYIAERYLSSAPQLEKGSGKGYTNSEGTFVPSPRRSDSGVPAGASARCRDGTYSFSRSRRGTCSHHGGVAKWF